MQSARRDAVLAALAEKPASLERIVDGHLLVMTNPVPHANSGLRVDVMVRRLRDGVVVHKDQHYVIQPRLTCGGAVDPVGRLMFDVFDAFRRAGV